MSRKIPWWLPQIAGGEYEMVREVLDSNYVNEGDFTSAFETKIAARLKVRHAVAVTSGTAAITLALLGLGIKPGDEVIIPDITFIATANAVVLAGAVPVLVDIDPRTLNIDPDAILRAITPRTRAIVPVHVSGRAADMDAILAIATARGLWVVEDAAEAFTSMCAGRYLGAMGNAGCLSFSPNKTITTGQGGIVLTDDDRLCGRLRELKDQGRPVRGTGGDDIHYSVGFNFKFTNLQAAVGLAQLSCLESRLATMRSLYSAYVRGLEGVPGISLPGFRLEAGECPQWTDAIVPEREKLDRYLTDRNIGCRRFWFPLHRQTPYRRADDDFPNSTAVSPQALWLPSAFTLSDLDIGFVCGHIRECLTGDTGEKIPAGGHS